MENNSERKIYTMKIDNNYYNKNYEMKSNYLMQKTICFNGKLGDKFVSQIIRGEEVHPKTITKEVKNIFGKLNCEKLEDITESLICKIKELHKENKNLRDENLYLAKNVVGRDLELLDSFSQKKSMSSTN